MNRWLLVAIAVSVALTANTLSGKWASTGLKANGWFWLMCAISPLVFITFGWATSKIGLSLASGTIDSLLTVFTVLVGFVLFGEWNKLAPMQYFGLAMAIAGVWLMNNGK